jgi:GNAT superfamily N-acetyltransferase
MPAWEIQRLDRKHNRSEFDCGQAMLNDWLQALAGQFDRRNLARTFVATRAESARVLGYYALSSHRIVYDALPDEESKGLPKLDIPVILLGRLAVDLTGQGQGLGADLLIDALRRSLAISQEIGIRAVEVDAIDESARRFYQMYGFRPLLDDPRHMFLPMQLIRQLGLAGD